MRKTFFYYTLVSVIAILAIPFMCACGGDDNDDNNDSSVNGKTSTAYVDLGLSVKWATCNLGASNPWEYGNYYAWGETKPKREYTVTNYTYKNSHPNTLPLTDDPASVNLGNLWHTPTKDEFNELLDKCERYKTTLNGTIGYRFVGPNGNSIFLPAGGCETPDSTYEAEKNVYGCYWTSSLGNSGIYLYDEMFNFPYSYVFDTEYEIRDPHTSYYKERDGSIGYSVRAVHP